jgi:hypothetical protein
MDFIDDLRDRLQRIAELLGGEDEQPPQPRATLPPGEEQGQGVRLRRQVEVLQKSALGLCSPHFDNPKITTHPSYPT